jgi:hypothetical protein
MKQLSSKILFAAALCVNSGCGNGSHAQKGPPSASACDDANSHGFRRP